MLYYQDLLSTHTMTSRLKQLQVKGLDQKVHLSEGKQTKTVSNIGAQKLKKD